MRVALVVLLGMLLWGVPADLLICLTVCAVSGVALGLACGSDYATGSRPRLQGPPRRRVQLVRVPA